MIPENITKEHIEKAIQEIDEQGIRKKRHSSTYDLEFNGNLYPPKLVISIANKFANGAELDPHSFYGGKDTPAFELLKKEGFTIVPKNDPILRLIEKYKVRISATKLENEIYKWKLVNEYKGRPNTDATDFFKEINSLNFENLIYQLGSGVLKHLAREKPEELRLLFKNLFDEKKDLTARVKYFNTKTLELYRSFEGKFSHHQDERSIAGYLTYHNPEKYTFYKFSFYKKFCNLLGIKEAKKNEKYPHYLELLNQFIEDYIKPDNELIELVKSLIPQFYDGTNNLLVAQDILFQMLDNSEDEVNYWIFQGNPNVFDFKAALEKNLLDDWTVTAHKDKIKIGDKVILWITGNNPGCYALAEVVSEPQEKLNSQDDHLWKKEHKEELKADIKIIHNLVNQPITKDQIAGIKELADLKVGNQGTNFSATKEQFSKLLELITNSATSFAQLLSKFSKDDLDTYFNFLKEIIETTHIAINDKRVVFSCTDDNLNFIVGQRYSWNLFSNNKKGKFGVISIEKLNEESEKFDGNEPLPYYTFFNKINFSENQIDLIIDGVKQELNRSNKSSYRKFNNEDFESYVFGVKKSSNPNNMNFPLNTILYGPPGTGKTYNTILKAAEIIENRKITEYEEAKGIFNKHLGNRIEFITFHQNYSYEDFIQGLRPETENDADLTFNKVDGVFKRISDRALNNLKTIDKAPEEISKDLLFDKAIESFVEEVEENGESYKLNDNVSIISVDKDAFRYTGENWKHSATGGLRMKFDDLKEFHKNNITNRKDIKNLNTISGLANQHATYYLLVYNKILQHVPEKVEVPIENIEKQNYVIIIDEINRANISRVFGELITLIEPDKRSHGAIPLKCTLPSGDVFMVPSNLYIIGTMNTADKSIALLDIALRRRFEFEAMYPKYFIEGKTINDTEVLEKINQDIISKKGYDFQIGHSYFMDSKEDPYNFINRMNKKVIPLLMEYFMNDEKDVKNILNNAGLEIEDNAWPIRIKGKRAKLI
ncbi:MAG: AAA family ATPase [Lutibacter sp.]|nr:AAA family ATPase [Lutibacter sp.]